MPSKHARNSKTNLTAVRLPLDLDEELRNYAAHTSTSNSQVIIAALREYLERRARERRNAED